MMRRLCVLEVERLGYSMHVEDPTGSSMTVGTPGRCLSWLIDERATIRTSVTTDGN